jgi:hypothetical protein
MACGAALDAGVDEAPRAGAADGVARPAGFARARWQAVGRAADTTRAANVTRED